MIRLILALLLIAAPTHAQTDAALPPIRPGLMDVPLPGTWAM